MPAARLLKELSDVSSRLLAARDIEEGLREMLAATLRLLGAGMGMAPVSERDRGVLTIVARPRLKDDFLQTLCEAEAGAETFCGRAIRPRRRVLAAEVAHRALGEGIKRVGAGLALAKTLVELHDGTFVAQIEGADRGSRFAVRPALSASAPDEDPSPSDPRASESRKVLIVDDDRDVADSLALLLETMGAATRAAYSGEEALEALAEVAPDVIFVDLGMPGMDGCATALALRARPEGRSAMLVALSGWGEETDRRRSREAGFDFHIVKPIAIETLERLLGAATKRG